MKRLLFTVLVLLLMGCQPAVTPLPESAWSKNNLGVGQMGAFDYDAAFQTFSYLHEQYPEQLIFHQNYIIATINRQQPDDEANAMQELKKMLGVDGNNAVARYLIGLLHFNQGDCESAITHFQWVVDTDSSDPYASYFLGQCLLQQGKLQAAYDQFNSTIDKDPYLRSAYYGAFMTSQRLGTAETAKKHLDAYQKMEMNPQSRLAEIKYTRMGPKAMALVNPATENGRKDTQLVFLKDSFNSKKQLSKVFNNNYFTVVNQDETEIWVTADNHIEVYRMTQSGIELARKLEAPGMSDDDLISIIDINQDGLLDGYVTRPNEPDRIYYSGADLKWQLIDQALTSGHMPESKRVQVADFDHDGDLDVLTLDGTGVAHLLSNNNDMTFRDISQDLIDNDKNMAFTDSALLDVDGDRDLDILLLKNQSLYILINDRMWYYNLKEHALPRPAHQLAVNYSDTGGPLLHVSSSENIISIGSYDAFSDSLTWQEKAFDSEFGRFDINDVNGDGVDDYLLHSSNQTMVVSTNDSTLIQILEHGSDQQSHHLIASLNGPELLTSNEITISHWPASSKRHGFLKLQLSGKELAADSMRSNALGWGTELIVHNNKQAKKTLYLNQSHQPNQSYGATNVASFIPMGELGQIDFLELLWSDGVYQTELSLQPAVNVKLTETQRQLSSCPVLFMQIDEQFEFLTDVMGVGAMGFLVSKDQYAQPRDWEFLLLDQDHVANSDFTFLVTEPMEETMFLDAVAMKVYETDANLNAVLDERLAIKSSQPSGELMFFTEQVLPELIISQDGSDQTNANLAVDANPLAVGELDLRFLGHLKEAQVHTMTYEQTLHGDMILMVHGWVEYGYSQTSFNAWQAGQSLQYPSLDAEIDGQWVTLLDNWGFPAGMPKMAAIEFTIPDGKTVQKLRIRSTQELYIDQISVAQRIFPEVEVKSLPLLTAKQSIIGFPLRENGPNRYPIYDFSQLQPFDDTRHMTGAYTQLGPVDPLVESKDNAIAIVSGGEAVTFQFEKPESTSPPDKKRFYVMEFYGWAKDMDMLTENDKFLLPLPKTGEITAQAKALNQRFNTRFMSGK